MEKKGNFTDTCAAVSSFISRSVNMQVWGRRQKPFAIVSLRLPKPGVTELTTRTADGDGGQESGSDYRGAGSSRDTWLAETRVQCGGRRWRPDPLKRD